MADGKKLLANELRAFIYDFPVIALELETDEKII